MYKRQLVETLDRIALWLSPVDGLKQLIFDDVPDRYFMARLKDKVDCERVIRAAGVFDLTFYCPDPFAYALEDEVFTITKAGETLITRSLGNIASRPVYFLKGSLAKAPENYISISVNGVEMKIINACLLYTSWNGCWPMPRRFQGLSLISIPTLM